MSQAQPASFAMFLSEIEIFSASLLGGTLNGQ